MAKAWQLLEVGILGHGQSKLLRPNSAPYNESSLAHDGCQRKAHLLLGNKVSEQLPRESRATALKRASFARLSFVFDQRDTPLMPDSSSSVLQYIEQTIMPLADIANYSPIAACAALLQLGIKMIHDQVHPLRYAGKHPRRPAQARYKCSRALTVHRLIWL